MYNSVGGTTMRVISKKEMLQYFAKPSYSCGESEFYSDLTKFYRQNSKRFQKVLSIRSEFEIMNFCTDYRGHFNYENLCKLALIFSNIVGTQLPDHIHNRIVLGPSNKWAQEYVEYVSSLKPLLFGLFNLNRKKISNTYLSSNGNLQHK